MPIVWREYDGFDWAGSRQEPMGGKERAAVEALVGDLLALSDDERREAWGAASPPGRYAATVVHVDPAVAHRYAAPARARGIAEIGVKLFKVTADARREAGRMLPFHRKGIHRLPGLPNAHVQKTLDAGTLTDGGGEDRDYIIQEWVPGETLEDLVRRHWPTEPIDGAQVRCLLEQLYAGIIIPLWAEGTVWWDVRDANYCWNEAAGRLILIDVDSLAAYVQEITETPAVWERRGKGQETALARLRQMTLRLLLAQGEQVRKKKVRVELDQAWLNGLEPALRALGREPARKEALTSEALSALRRFLDRLTGP